MSQANSEDKNLVDDDPENVHVELPDLSRYEMKEDKLPIGHFAMRPSLEEKFKSETVREIIHSVLIEHLKGKVYSAEMADEWVKTISVNIKNKVKELNYKKYKLMVHVVLGEQKGSGVRIACRCLWDADSDGYAFDTFMNE
ncbi:dynein light chain Tctex-type protein 2B-like isoform X2 [Lycorma delicatula]|uniref:dynein light chain Tctex-type protein 2B-like isoform X2 n=1 Tax=Lycorma delicatula TaxID=130591 RepID=UPI003F51970D